MWRAPLAPAARTAAVTVWRPRQWIQPATSSVKLAAVGAWKHAVQVLTSWRKRSGKMRVGMAGLLGRHIPRIQARPARQCSAPRPCRGTKMAQVESSRLLKNAAPLQDIGAGRPLYPLYLVA